MAGIKEVAARAGVSSATVSRAFSGNGKVSEATRRKVQAAADELGFVISYNASSLASGRSRNIGIVMPTVGRWYFSQVLEGAAAALIDAGYDLTLYNTGDSPGHRESVLTEMLRRKRLDAVIAVALKLTDEELSQLHAVGKPIVAIGGPLPQTHTIRVDEANISALATEHLIALGHTRIAHIGGGEELERDFRMGSTRRDGYEQAMGRAGLKCVHINSPDFSVGSGVHAAKTLLAAPGRPTGIFCASDEIAIGTILAAKSLGLRVPEDLSVIGIDGHELGEVFGLTTISQDPRGQGAAAVAAVLSLLQQEPLEADWTQRFYPTEFVVRSSTSVPADLHS
ncbi:LacI family DNA-binding transcriptional regulator [Arthrobacter sp. zg-Y820]|uniref:LacI family DNA-binding transcriptional regulator n=1 Tax=unclassified Arthrobacter TaxID=235627 RepID=UPI00254219A9|nr:MULTISPECIES: LacI family DNA-binding transcriptional regulator [unclassified Arthrobacter]MCC9198582.1 LacI family transcriptional regulator [Arthrobacter sp. zg-Y820]MDK1281452.1 LacI family DNA-binding transcriptional regulator [Arthrobacter sp. zg.Y820]MDK1361845.1 LacI family DNA-binding transcriptional regulator [Arthrobacter sp. zg-Y1219]WIB09894.1 LacI family DNA-binding transcriptional regulator [Arthrobacter sp. zg-Y820]